MLITFGKLNTLHYGGDQGEGARTSPVSWLCSVPTFTPFWVLTGLSGSGVALCSYRRSFFLSQGISGCSSWRSLQGPENQADPSYPAVLSLGVGGSEGGPSLAAPLLLTAGQQKCWAVSQVFCGKQFNIHLFYERCAIENNNFCSPRTTCYIIFYFIFSLSMSGGLWF